MKTILVNGVEQNIAPEGLTFSKFVDDFNTDLAKDAKIIAQIKVDGADVTNELQAQICEANMANLGTIEIFTSSPMELALETLSTLEQYLGRIIQNIDRAGSMYRTKNYVSADSYFMKTIDGLDLFVQTMGGIKSALRIGMNTKVALAEATLISIMNDLLDAKKQNNYIMLAELLSTDLIDNMKEWRDVVFPALRTKTSS